MTLFRSSGILLHPTSLPNAYGIGDLGRGAYRFVEFLLDTAQSLWQVLPLGPTGYANSPYQSFSAFAGNPLLIGIEQLLEQDLLSKERLEKLPPFDDHRVDYGKVIPIKMSLLREAFQKFKQLARSQEQEEFSSFCETNKAWLDDYALFMSLKAIHDERPWPSWPQELAARKREALDHYRSELAEDIRFRKFLQFQFFKQWTALKTHCNRRGIKIIGDIPIFAAHDSADVWSHPEWYRLDRSGKPVVVAGVPPDYFSATGQLWGNPIYRWDRMAETGYEWWIKRIEYLLNFVDFIRLDHFRGFEKYWEVPGGEKTAVNGRWVEGPGSEIFEAILKKLGKLPIIAEDLGVITPEVEALRNELGFPGMNVLQFAFGHDRRMAQYIKTGFPENSVVYTGTHDNDTTIGWFKHQGGRSLEEMRFEIANALNYLGTNGSNINWDLIKVAMKSDSAAAIFPLQDVLSLDTEARMNVPGTTENNWEWRFTFDMITEEIKEKLRNLTVETFRQPHFEQLE